MLIINDLVDRGGGGGGGGVWLANVQPVYCRRLLDYLLSPSLPTTSIGVVVLNDASENSGDVILGCLILGAHGFFLSLSLPPLSPPHSHSLSLSLPLSCTHTLLLFHHDIPVIVNALAVRASSWQAAINLVGPPPCVL